MESYLWGDIMETYFKARFISEYIVPILIFAVLAIILIIWIIIITIFEKMKYRYLKDQGWKREIYAQDSVTGIKLYRFVKSGRSISESRVDRMKYSELKRFIEDGCKH